MSAPSVFDLFKIGIGPSSSHTVGPMIAAKDFVTGLNKQKKLHRVEEIRCELFGSLGATGRGHGSDKAVILGLMGEDPKTVDTDKADEHVAAVRQNGRITLMGGHQVPFKDRINLVLHKRRSLPYHPNGMRFTAADSYGHTLADRCYYSVGGGFVVNEEAVAEDNPVLPTESRLPYPFSSGAGLLAQCEIHDLQVSDVMLANECSQRDEAEVRSGLLEIWQVMQASVERGCNRQGELPGGLKVRRRAPGLYRSLKTADKQIDSPLESMNWVNLYALAVNEENAAGGRIVTAPTNGAAGIVPAVLHYYHRHCKNSSDDGVVRFLLAAAAVGILFKLNASISGAEVGCQGEVGSACSMAAAGLAEVLGGNPEQVENAAEIGMEHNLGLTCDPIGGLVQIPCIERNAMASVKAINAAHLALWGNGEHYVSLDKVIKTMRDTGLDMKTKYKETARGGLALNVVEVPVSVIEC